MCTVEGEWSIGAGEGGGQERLAACICVQQPKLADLIRRVGPNEWGSILSGVVGIQSGKRGTGVLQVTESQTGCVALHCSEAVRPYE